MAGDLISCTRHQATAASAAFVEESRMEFINANRLHRKSGEHGISIVPGVRFRGLSFSAGNHICMQARHLRTVEMQDCGPFTLAVVAPDDAATQKVRDRARRQIAMEIEETG